MEDELLYLFILEKLEYSYSKQELAIMLTEMTMGYRKRSDELYTWYKMFMEIEEEKRTLYWCNEKYSEEKH